MQYMGMRNGSERWRAFIRSHWKMFSLIVLGLSMVCVGAVLVFLWFLGNAQSTGMVPTALALWTMGNIVTFMLNLIFWEVLLVGVPTALAAIAAWSWWKRLPLETRDEYRLFSTRSRSSRGGNAISFLVFIAFCIKVFIDGNWNVAIVSWTLDYLAYSVLSAFIWIAIIFGIPLVIGFVWWVRHKEVTNP
jgi:hypothetical protein